MTRAPLDEKFVIPLYETLGLETKAGKEALLVALDNVRLLDAKQRDYGPHNISAFGLFGCVVRLNDKVERLKHIHGFSGEQKKAMRRVGEIMRLCEKNWHRFNLIETLDHLEDSMTQFKVLFAKKRRPVVNEKLRDTFRDIANYAVIALLLDSGKWPTTED